MKLVGLYISPFVRRVAIALHIYGIDFEHVAASVVTARDLIVNYNGLVRVPSLEMDDGDVLVDSHQILAELDRLAGPERSLSVRDAGLLRPYGQMLAFLTGALEKQVAAFYETGRRPPDKIWAAWADQCVAQALGGLGAAEDLADTAVLSGSFLFENRLTHADVAAVLAFEAITARMPIEFAAQRFPKLAALSARLAPTSPFLLTDPHKVG
jgi:glutathione S-transferase